jgi:phosphopantetheinyl transferase
MPLAGLHSLGGVDVWVWRITETADELSLLVDEGCATYARDAFTSEKRRAEWLAVRAVLARKLPGARIVYDDAGKPLLEGAHGHLSISHTDGYAVVAFSPGCEVGVDVELVSRDVLSVSRRFMPQELLGALPPAERNRMALLNWCAKEALYKITGDLGGNFKENISVECPAVEESGRFALSLVGLDYAGELLYVADYSFYDDLLVVLCRKRCNF